MKITKNQLRRIIREADGNTEKYNDDSALRGDQSKLPDALQKGIIDKTVEDREERESEEREEKNESLKFTKTQLRRIIREEYPVAGGSSPSWKAFEDAAWTAAAELVDAGMESVGVLGAMQDTLVEIFKEIWENERE